MEIRSDASDERKATHSYTSHPLLSDIPLVPDSGIGMGKT